MTHFARPHELETSQPPPNELPDLPMLQ
jgi:hypothetical protein